MVSSFVTLREKTGGAAILPAIFKPFVEKSPISVMSRGIIERFFNPAQLNEWFDSIAEEQYTKDLLFSTVLNIMSLVVCGVYHSVHAAYQASKEEIGVSVVSVYNKLNGIEINTSQQLVRYAVSQAEPVIKKLGGRQTNPLPGKRIKLLDGNCIETAFQHLAEYLNSEINTLGYPKTALFGFCVSLVAYIGLCVVRAALGNVHGTDVIEEQVSDYYIANEISGTYQGMMIAIDQKHRSIFQKMPQPNLLKILKELAGKVKLSAYKKHPRGPKKPQAKHTKLKNKNHVSTAKIIKDRKK